MQLPLLSQLDRLIGVPQTAEAWSLTPVGSFLATREREVVDTLVAEVFGYYALQLGDSHRDLLAGSLINTHVRVGRGGNCAIHSELYSLPFESSTVDLVLLAHALEFSPYPEALMRDSYRVLRPEGRLLVLGFNPSGLYGLRRQFDSTGGYPWYGEFFRPKRIYDWFSVLGMSSEHGTYVGYAPPRNAGGERTQATWEAAGDRWWPLLGGVYILQAIKRVPAMRRLRPAWRGKVGEIGIPAGVAKRQGLSTQVVKRKSLS